MLDEGMEGNMPWILLVILVSNGLVEFRVTNVLLGLLPLVQPHGPWLKHGLQTAGQLQRPPTNHKQISIETRTQRPEKTFCIPVATENRVVGTPHCI